MKKTMICVMLTLLVILTACTGARTEPETTTAPTEITEQVGFDPAEWSAVNGKGKVGAVLPDFSVATADGGSFTLSEALRDHELVLINLWATWCPPCGAEFPYLEQAYAGYKDRVAVIALSVEQTDTLEAIRDFAAIKRLSFPMGRDEIGALAAAFHVTGIPTSLLVDRSFRVLWLETGAKTATNEFTELFDAYLDGDAAAGKTEYTVTVLDQNNEPVPGCVISFCTEESCIPVIADEAGKAVFSGEPYAYHLQVLSVPEGYDYNGADDLFVNAAGDSVTVTLTRLDR